MIMLGSGREGGDEFGRVQSTPAALGGITQSPYLVMADADAVYRRAWLLARRSWTPLMMFGAVRRWC